MGRFGIGASFSLPRLPATVSSLNAERPLGLGGANWPSCPIAAVRLRPKVRGAGG
jgi:hypothetical protein